MIFELLQLLVLAAVLTLGFFVWRLKLQNSIPDPRLDQLGIEVRRLESLFREEMGRAFRELREEVTKSIQSGSESTSGILKNQLSGFAEQNARLTETIEGKLNQIRENNDRRLEEMRKTVDEKLQSTLEKRLGESFRLVVERLEMVHKGLGEMQNLASGVGDLKRVLTNVKTRGTWGEIQLRAILEQILHPSQWQANVRITPNSNEVVEFALKLPGKDDNSSTVWLPIDSKFPRESYERILGAQDRGDADGVALARSELARSLKGFARDIRDKYISPPHSTDFAVLFLPTEGLFAEVCRDAVLLEEIQRDFRVTVAGPTTLAALLNSLQMGFQTLAIQKRSSEVWQLLGAIKAEFLKFGDLISAVDKKLEEARNKIRPVMSKTSNINRKLKNVHELPASQVGVFLDLDETEALDGEDS
ncbi:MAG: DNA recombination protein RmuC [Bdellovibrionaceae bacterium]|nr:DNA recombination protein RmuC [Pseudobdellovibrionaceae bacterium]